MNVEFKKLLSMVQPKESRFIKMRDEILNLSMAANDKGLQFLQNRYFDLVTLSQGYEGITYLRDTDEMFPPIPDDIPQDLPIDLPYSKDSAGVINVDLSQFKGTNIKLKYGDESMTIAADQVWAVLVSFLKDS